MPGVGRDGSAYRGPLSAARTSGGGGSSRIVHGMIAPQSPQ